MLHACIDFSIFYQDFMPNYSFTNLNILDVGRAAVHDADGASMSCPGKTGTKHATFLSKCHFTSFVGNSIHFKAKSILASKASKIYLLVG